MYFCNIMDSLKEQIIFSIEELIRQIELILLKYDLNENELLSCYNLAVKINLEFKSGCGTKIALMTQVEDILRSFQIDRKNAVARHQYILRISLENLHSIKNNNLWLKSISFMEVDDQIPLIEENLNSTSTCCCILL